MKLAEIAEQIGGVLEGEGNPEISGIAGLDEAGSRELSFLANPKYASAVAATAAGAVVVGSDWDGSSPCPVIKVDNPDRAMALGAALLGPAAATPAPGIHPTAVVAEDAKVAAGASVGPHCVVEAGAEIGAGTVMVAMCYVGRDAVIGGDCLLHPQAIVSDRVRIGERVILHDGAVVGSDGFGNYREDGQWKKIPQIGTVEIGDDAEIGANTTIDRARFGTTVIGRGVKIDNLVQIAHNVRVGEHSAMAALVGVSGSTRIGAHVMIAGQAGVAGHVEIGDGVFVLARTGVTKDIRPGSVVSGFPAMPQRDFAILQANTRRLPALKQRVKELEERLARLEESR